MRLIPTLLAVCACLCVAAAFAVAQDDKPVRLPLGSKTQLPFEVTGEGAQRTWRINGRGTIKIEDLLGGLASATGKRVAYSRTAMELARSTVSYLAPDEGVTVPAAEIPLYVSDLLGAAELTVTGFNGTTLRVVRLSEVAEYATAVEGNDLSTFPEAEWVTVFVVSSHGGGGDLDHFWKDPMRLGRYHVRTVYNGVLVSGRVDVLRPRLRMFKLVDQAGASGGAFVRSYDAPAGINAADAKRALQELFVRKGTSVNALDGKYQVTESDQSDAQISISPGSSKLLVRARAADHASVEVALAAMAGR